MGLNRRHLLPSIPVSILILFVTVPVFADSIVIETDSDLYFTGDVMIVSGHISDLGMPVVAISIFDPDGDILSANSVPVESNGTFTRIITLDSPFYDKAGLYLIAAEYGRDSAFVIFEVISNKAQEQITEPIKIEPKVTAIGTDKNSYRDDDFVTISGTVSAVSEPTILIGIYNPDESPAGFYIADIGAELKFSTTFLAKSGVNFKTPGTYHAKAYYANTNLSTTFSFVDSPPPQSQPATESNEQQKTKTAEKPAVPQSSPVAEKKEEVKVPETKTVQQEQEEPSAKDTDNLSIEDIELGKMLNEIILNCDVSEFKDAIVYNDNMGPALMRLCEYEQAITHFDNALMNNPDNVEIYTNKGSALAKTGQYNNAIIHYNMALKIDPGFVPALNNKANVLAASGQLDDAISIYNTILRVEPSYTVAQKNLEKAEIKYEKSYQSWKSEEVVEHIEQAPVRQPEPAEKEMPESTPPKPENEKNFFDQIGIVFSLIGNILGF